MKPEDLMKAEARRTAERQHKIAREKEAREAEERAFADEDGDDVLSGTDLDDYYERFETGFMPLADFAKKANNLMNRIPAKYRVGGLIGLTGLAAVLVEANKAEAGFYEGPVAIEAIPPNIVDNNPGSEPVETYFPKVEAVIHYDREVNLERARELGVPAMYEVLADSPNSEAINDLARLIFDLPPGDYDGILEPERPEDVLVATRKASRVYEAGTSRRAMVEMAILYKFADYEDSGAYYAHATDLHYRTRSYDSEIKNRIDEVYNLDIEKPTLGDFLRLQQIFASKKARRHVLERMFNIIQSGEVAQYGLRPLTPSELDWTSQTGVTDKNGVPVNVSRESLIWAVNMEPLHNLMIKCSPRSFFPKTLHDRDDPAAIMQDIFSGQGPNAGATTMLQQSETLGTEFPGAIPYGSQLNQSTGRFPTSLEGARNILLKIDETYGIPYSMPFTSAGGSPREAWQYFPGSERGMESSGGAINGQHMGNNAEAEFYYYELAQYDTYNNVGLVLAERLPGSVPFIMLDTRSWLAGHRPLIQGHSNGENALAWSNAKGGWTIDPLNAVTGWNPSGYQARWVTKAQLTFGGANPAQPWNIDPNNFTNLEPTPITLDDGQVVNYYKYE